MHYGSKLAHFKSPASGCANINVDIGGEKSGIPTGIPSSRKSASELCGRGQWSSESGEQNGLPIISSIRRAWAVNGVTTSFSQLMGLPLEQLSVPICLPRLQQRHPQRTAENIERGHGRNHGDGHHRRDPQGTYPLAAGAAVRINYPGLDSGPVVVQGTSGVKIISAIREAWAVNGVTNSFVQLMGLPAGQLSNKYVFPAYNNVTLNEQLRIERGYG